MASARFRMIGVVLFVVALSALEAYQWDGGPEDKAKMTACLGGRASFPWSILTGSETIVNTAWSFQAPDKGKIIIATYHSAHFFATDTVRFGFLANAGLSIRFARPQDSGNYSVQVQLQQAKSSELVLAERTVTLSVTDLPPATQDGSFYVTLSDAVRDDVTQDWTLQLHCGQFVDLGQPPVDVAWKTPSGEVRNSSYQDNGTFVLSVPSPVQGGNANCLDWLKLDPQSAIRTVYISGDPITVYCDQTTDNGGWIVFQRRQDASVDFYRDWAEYRNGFGDLEGNFWLGLDKLHKLTTSQRYELRVDLRKWNGTKGNARYSGFYVDDVSHNFALHYDSFTGGNAGDSLYYQRDRQFTTKDMDHDPWLKPNCAQRYHGAWWYQYCHRSNLNGDYKTSSSAPKFDGVSWITFGGSNAYSMKFTEMKIRPIM